MKELVHIVYHDPCWDGATAAAVAKIIFTANSHRVTLGRFEPYSYSTGFSTEFIASVLDSHNEGVSQTIYLLDVSFEIKSEVGRRDLTTLVGLANGNTDIDWIDHHASSFTAWDSLVDSGVVPNGNFSMTLSKHNSGALLTLNHLTDLFKYPFADKLLPFVETVSDQDLWNFKLDHTRRFMTALSKVHTPSLEAAEKTMLSFFDLKPLYVAKGEEILDMEKASFEAAYQTSFVKTILGRDFICVAHNCFDSLSRLAAYIYEHHDKPVCIIVPRVDGVKLSFRSDRAAGEVLSVASSMGGGGHDYAAGAFITYVKFAELFTYNKFAELFGGPNV